MHQQYREMQLEANTPLVKRHRKSRAEAEQNQMMRRIQTRSSTYADLMKQKESSGYKANPHLPELPTEYSMRNQNNIVDLSNQVLYPNMRHVPNSTPYQTSQQQTQLTNSHCTMNEQSAACHYNSRRGVHNLPITSAPTHWHTIQPLVSQQDNRAQQMNTLSPVEFPLPKQTKENSAQTEFDITEKEIMFLTKLRAMGVTPERVLELLEKDDHVVPLGEVPQDAERCKRDKNGNYAQQLNNEVLNNIINRSNDTKRQIIGMASACQMFGLNALNALTASQAVMNPLRAIQYQQIAQNNQSNTPTPPQPQTDDNYQDGNNDNEPEYVLPNQQRARQQCPETPRVPQESFAIPNIANFYGKFQQRRNIRGRSGMPIPPPVPNIPANLLQAAAFYVQNNINPYGMQQFFPNNNNNFFESQ